MLLEFLIAHVLNGYEAIMGADFLLNESLLAAITPNSIILTKQYKSTCIPLMQPKDTTKQLNFVHITDNIRLPAHSSRRIKMCSTTQFTDPLSETELYSHNEVQYSLRDATTTSETTLECTITNNSDCELNFTDQAILAST
jgi:hypothetical protein